MAVANSKEERLKEAKSFAKLLVQELPNFQTKIGLQINISCPSTLHKPNDLSREGLELLQIFSALEIPLDLKANVFIDLETVRELEASGLCDVLTISNTIPAGSLGAGIDWRALFDDQLSPLAHLGGGGLSGDLIFPIVFAKIHRLRKAGILMPIKASGGIINVSRVEAMKIVGAQAIEIATVLMLRPWRVKAIIERAQKIFV